MGLLKWFDFQHMEGQLKLETSRLYSLSPSGSTRGHKRAGVAYMDVAVRRPGKGREQERKLEGISLKASPSSPPSARRRTAPEGRRSKHTQIPSYSKTNNQSSTCCAMPCSTASLTAAEATARSCNPTPVPSNRVTSVSLLRPG